MSLAGAFVVPGVPVPPAKKVEKVKAPAGYAAAAVAEFRKQYEKPVHHHHEYDAAIGVAQLAFA